MIGRVILKLIVVVSLLLAIALLILWVRTRQSDLLISSASGGTYRELRMGRSELGFMLVSGWKNAQPTRLGRAPRPSQETWITIPRSTAPGAKNAPNTFALFDGTTLSLQPTPAPWWQPIPSRGTVLLG